MRSNADDELKGKPTKRFAGDERFDFAFRPDTYWPDLPTEETVSDVKGTVRRDVARRLLSDPDPTAPEGVGDFLLGQDLGEKGKDLWGSLHPRNLGGEFLPDPETGEAEIARIELASVTGDVCQVRARRGEGNCIHYRVVDEYWDEGVRYLVSQETSDEPLTLGELIELIDTSERGDEVYAGGLVDSHRAYLFQEEAWIDGPAEIAFFATVTSAFYPMLSEYYTARSEAWLAEIEAEARAEREDEENEWLEGYRKRLDEHTEAVAWSGSPDELPEDLADRAQLLIVEGHLDGAERICDELGERADDLRVMMAIKRGDIDEAVRLAKKIDGSL